MATYLEMKTEVALIAGNLQTSHPLYTYIGTYVNRAANKLIRMAPQMFPEMVKSFPIGPTVAGTNSIAYPSGVIAIKEVYSARQGTSPNWNITRSYPVTYLNPGTFDLIAKDATVVGYPTIYTRLVNSLMLWPTPSASYIDYLHLFGVGEEAALSVDGSTFAALSVDWHDTVIKLAASILLERMTQFDDARELLASVKLEVRDALNQRAEESMGRESAVMVNGAPTRGTVYP